MPLRWTARIYCGRPLSRLVATPAQSSVPERLRELRLRRRVERQTFDVALSCTGTARLPAVVLLVKNLRRRRRSVRARTQSLTRRCETASRRDERRLAAIERFPRARA